MKEYEQIYSDFWKPLVEVKGKLNKAQLMKELADYYDLMSNASKVYYHITDGNISKCNTTSEAVIGETDRINEKWVEEYIKDAKEPLEVYIEVLQANLKETDKLLRIVAKVGLDWIADTAHSHNTMPETLKDYKFLKEIYLKGKTK